VYVLCCLLCTHTHNNLHHRMLVSGTL
jgi:hypothetical protein